MVVFTCNNCGDSLQKPRVAKHYQFQCHRPISLSCVDCFKDFRGEEYVVHTKCITEDERYGGKDYVAKPSANKGQRKQEEWINVVQNLLNNSTDLSNAERSFLNTLSRHENIPRKKAKFLNFIKTAVGHKTNMSVVESAWTKMETAFKEAAGNNTNSQQKNGKRNGDGNEGNLSLTDHQESDIIENQNNENLSKENGETKQQSKKNNEKRDIENGSTSAGALNCTTHKKSKKRVLSESSGVKDEQPVSKRKNKGTLENSPVVECQENVQKSDKFNWESVIFEIVQSKVDISLKKLQKKVLARYASHIAAAVVPEKAVSKFSKKLGKVSGIIIAEQRVKLAGI